MKELTIEYTIGLIQELHANQFDWSGKPYWHHPVAVMNLLPEDSSLDRRFVALLHDTIEDTEADESTLLGLGYSEHVVKSVALLSRPDHENVCYAGVDEKAHRKNTLTYLDGIRLIASSGNLDAMWVKYCDNKHNSADERTVCLEGDLLHKALSMRKRYAKSMSILAEALGIDPEHTVSGPKF